MGKQLTKQDSKSKQNAYFNQLRTYDEISSHGKLPVTVCMARYLVMAGSHHVVLDRCGILVLWSDELSRHHVKCICLISVS